MTGSWKLLVLFKKDGQNTNIWFTIMKTPILQAFMVSSYGTEHTRRFSLSLSSANAAHASNPATETPPKNALITAEAPGSSCGLEADSKAGLR